MATAWHHWRVGSVWLVAGGLVLAGCPSQTSGDDDDDGIEDDDTGGGDDDASGEWEVILSDDFERPDGPLGDDYEVLVYQGNEIAEIQGGEVIADTEFFAVRYIHPVHDETIRVTADLRYELAFEGVEEVEVALVARWAEDAGGDFPSYGAGVDGAADVYSLGRTLVSGETGESEVVDGGSWSTAVDPGTVYRVVLTVDGGDVTGDFLDTGAGTSEWLMLEDAEPLTEGVVGVHGHITGDVVVYFDDLLIERYRESG